MKGRSTGQRGEAVHGDLSTLQEGQVCIQDTTSSLGGRCVFETSVHERQRELQVGTPCTFKNGTFGVKCVGTRACYNIDVNNVGCGSCYGTYSCQYDGFGANAVSIGENSWCVWFISLSLHITHLSNHSPTQFVHFFLLSSHGYLSCYRIGWNSFPATVGDNSW